MCELEIIGEVKSKFQEPVKPQKMRQYESDLVIKPEFADGLYRIEDNDYLQVIFYFHLAEGYELKAARRHGKKRGVFACRSPRRPNSVGATVVELLAREDNQLKVTGLDAVDGTPIIDLKPYAPCFDQAGACKE